MNHLSAMEISDIASCVLHAQCNDSEFLKNLAEVIMNRTADFTRTNQWVLINIFAELGMEQEPWAQDCIKKFVSTQVFNFYQPAWLNRVVWSLGRYYGHEDEHFQSYFSQLENFGNITLTS